MTADDAPFGGAVAFIRPTPQCFPTTNVFATETASPGPSFSDRRGLAAICSLVLLWPSCIQQSRYPDLSRDTHRSAPENCGVTSFRPIGQKHG